MVLVVPRDNFGSLRRRMKYRLQRGERDGKVERGEGDIYININSTSCLTSEGGAESEDV